MLIQECSAERWYVKYSLQLPQYIDNYELIQECSAERWYVKYSLQLNLTIDLCMATLIIYRGFLDKRLSFEK